MKISKRLYFSAANLLLILLLVSSCSMFQKAPPPEPLPQLQQASVGDVMQMPMADSQAQQPPLPGTQPPAPPIAAAQPPVTPPQAAIAQPMTINPDAKYKVAVLVPLSGGTANIGRQIIDAAQMAILDSGTKDYQIMPFDTATQGGAGQAAVEALAAHANVILGPVFSGDVTLVAAKAKAANIRVFSFSNNKSVASGNAYILGMVPEQQTNRIISYAGSHGLKGFSAFLPNNSFGTQLATTIKRLAKVAGGEVVKIENYSFDYDSAAKDLSDGFGKKSITLDKRNQALIVPEGGDKLPEILTALAKAGFSNNSIQIIGTSFWDREEIITNPLTDGAWYTSTPYEGEDAFNNRFNVNYKYKPDDIAAIAYDATNLVIEAINGNYSDNDLKRNSGFKGVKGIYKFDKNNVDIRSYAIYQITNGGAHVIDPAPDRF